jgi:signal transduction histidine kinase
MNSCYIFISSIDAKEVILTNYSHIIPVFLATILGIFVFVKTKFNLLSKVFLSFIVVFSLWLIGDLITWTSTNYHLIYSVWSFLDYLEVLFYLFGLYFVLILVYKKDLSPFFKTVLFLFSLPLFIFTIMGYSVVGFNQPLCEAFNSGFSGSYKLIVESGVLLVILFFIITPFVKKEVLKIKKTNLIVFGSMFLFLSIFGVTEYIASTTGNYQLNLYSLFLLPIFIFAVIYAIFELDIFNFNILETQYLVVGLVILITGQLFFVSGGTDILLTIITIITSVTLSIILFGNLKRESDQRIEIEKLNIDLGRLVEQRESLMHLINHKVKSSFTHTKYIFSEILEGSFGPISPELKKIAEVGLNSDDLGVKTIDLILNAANLQKGTVKYEFKQVALKPIVLKAIENKKDLIQKKNLDFEMNIGEGDYLVNGDAFWLEEVVNNLIDNAFNYTNEGKIIAKLEKKDNKILFSVKDTGMGITKEDKKNLFKEGGRGKESVKVNVNSTGYGLYSVKLIVEAHKGRVWAESEGAGKGAEFFVELDAL